MLRVSPMQFQCTSMPGKTETSASASPPPTTRLGRRRVPAVPLHPLLPFPVPEATGSSKRTPACREPLRSSARDPPPEGAPRTDEDRREPPRGDLLFSDADKQALLATRPGARRWRGSRRGVPPYQSSFHFAFSLFWHGVMDTVLSLTGESAMASGVSRPALLPWETMRFAASAAVEAPRPLRRAIEGTVDC